VGVQGFMISAFSENKLLARTFLTEFIATKDVMLKLYERATRPPAFLPALEEVSTNPDIQGYCWDLSKQKISRQREKWQKQ